ncbi:MAG: hypothetical protein LC785_01235 [Acidobacteria bacterium]|nr:hypothetical protein [Acidobacteriota bacterium]
MVVRFTNALDRVRIAAPCEADWDEMRGDKRVRFCHRCSLNVYNLSEMTSKEAERLVMRWEGARLCVRFYCRKDGTMLTRSCPVGLRALKRRVSKVSSAVFATIIGFFAGVGIAPAPEKSEPVSAPVSPVSVPDTNVTQYEPMMGAMGAMISPTGEQYATGAALGFVLFVIGYPAAKLRERSEAKRREQLRIWRNS